MASAPVAVLHVLVVDPNDVSRAATTEQLELCNYKVTSVQAIDAQLSQLRVADGTSASSLHLPRFDVAMVEHAPPEASARPVIQHLQNSALEVPVIVTSTLDDRQGVLECLHWGADDYLIRPLRINELGNIWVHLWRRVHPPPGLVSVMSLNQAQGDSCLQPASDQPRSGLVTSSGEHMHRMSEEGHLISNEGSNPGSTDDQARACEPDSQLASGLNKSLDASGRRSETSPSQHQESRPINTAFATARQAPSTTGAVSSREPLMDEIGSPRLALNHNSSGNSDEPEEIQAGLEGMAGIPEQQVHADKPEGDASMQGFRAWVSPESPHQRPASRKRSMQDGAPDAYGEEGKGSGGDAQMQPSGPVSAMHRPGGSALHSRTKQQCLRSGQAQGSNGPAAWNASEGFPSYTQLARQQSQQQPGFRVQPLPQDLNRPHFEALEPVAENTVQASASSKADACRPPTQRQSHAHMQAFAAGMASATSSLSMAQQPQLAALKATGWGPQALASHQAATAMQARQDASGRHRAAQSDSQHEAQHAHGPHARPPTHHAGTLQQQQHDASHEHRPTHHLQRDAPNAPPHGGDAQGRPGHPRDREQWTAWDQAQREQQEYGFLHSLWRQHFQPQPGMLPPHSSSGHAPHDHAHHEQLAQRAAQTLDAERRRSQDAHRQSMQHEQLWEAFQQQQQQQQQRAPAQQARPQMQDGVPSASLLPQFPWPGMDAASPEAQAFVAAYTAYFAHAANAAEGRQPKDALANAHQAPPPSHAHGRQPHWPHPWGSISSGHASNPSASQSQDVYWRSRNNPGCSSIDLGGKSAPPADERSQAGPHTGSGDVCKAPARRSLDLPAGEASWSHAAAGLSRLSSASLSRDVGRDVSPSIPRGRLGPLITSPAPSLRSEASQRCGTPGPAELTCRERRAAALEKYKQKRKNLCHTRKIRYAMRKQLAQARPRVRGQFVKLTSAGSIQNSSGLTQGASELGEEALSDAEDLEDPEEVDSEEEGPTPGAEEAGPTAAGAMPSTNMPDPSLAALQALKSAGHRAYPEPRHAADPPSHAVSHAGANGVHD